MYYEINNSEVKQNNYGQKGIIITKIIIHIIQVKRQREISNKSTKYTLSAK